MPRVEGDGAMCRPQTIDTVVMLQNSAAGVQDLLSFIRDFIQHPRRLDPLLKDKAGWNMLTSAMDTVDDTESAILSYERSDDSDKGMLYLLIYGLLQAMYVQQDALANLVRALSPKENYEIGSEPEAKFIRDIRNSTVGHPTKRGEANTKEGKPPGEQTSFAIAQHSMCKAGYTLVKTSNLHETEFLDYDMGRLIAQNRLLAARVLTRTKIKLEAIEMEHRDTFKGEKLVDYFPKDIGYSFGRILTAIHSPSEGNSPIGEILLHTVDKSLSDFRAALEKRGVLSESNDLPYELEQVEYAIAELGKYFQGISLFTDSRAASIFAHYSRDRMKTLRQMAEEIDAEYEASCGGHNDVETAGA